MSTLPGLDGHEVWVLMRSHLLPLWVFCQRHKLLKAVASVQLFIQHSMRERVDVADGCLHAVDHTTGLLCR